ncbi:MAG: TnsD family Tn7-like transposition protein [Bacilli bacterium]|nr:TnsD family Tn7-like transposition protein [Bacilli bacterium]
MELTEAIKEFYSEEYLKTMQSEINEENNWISKFIREGNKNKHILRHLLMIQFLDLSIEEVFNAKETIGKKKYIYIPNPRLDRDVQREKWLQVIKDNPNLSKSEYKRIGKGLYSWLYKNDNEWFEKITPKKKKY